MIPRWTNGVSRHQLSNGCVVLSQRLERPASAVVVRVRAGFFDEPDAIAGISHVLEHMIFKGTPRRPGPGSIARAVRSAGGYINAATSYDYTSYYTVLPAEEWRTGVQVLTDAVQHPILAAEELRRELLVIIEEAKRKRDTPGAVAVEALYALLHDRHRIRRWRIGQEDALAAFTQEQVAAYHVSRYHPGRMIVSVVGPHDPDQMADEAAALLTDWAPGSVTIPSGPVESGLPVNRVKTIRGDVMRSTVLVGWRTVPPEHDDHSALSIAAAVLARGRGSWFGRTLRDTGLATSLEAHQYAPTELGVFLLGAQCDPETIDRGVDLMRGEVNALSYSGPTDQDVHRVRTLLQVQWASQLDTVEGRAHALASAESRGGVATLEEEFERLLTVDSDTVRQASARWLQEETASAVLYHPEDRGDDLSVDALHRTVHSTRTERPSLPMPEWSGLATVPSRRTNAVSHARLPGVDLLATQMPHLHISTVAIHQRRWQFDEEGQEGLGVLAVRTAIRGAGRFDAPDLAQAFESQGGVVLPSIGPDSFGFSSTVLGDRVATAARLLRMVWEEARGDDEQVAREVSVLAADAARATDDMYRYPIQLAMSKRFAGHGYGRPLLGTPESVADLTGQQVRHWYATAKRGRPVVVVVGNHDPEQMVALLAGIFDGIGRDTPEPQTESPTPSPGLQVIERERAQTAIGMLFPGPSRLSEERYVADVWAALSGGLGGRLFTALRDRRSLAYTVAAAPWTRAGVGGLLTYIATSPEREEEARQAMLDELARLQTDPPTRTEVEASARYVSGQEVVGRQTPQAVAAELLEAWLIGSGLDEVGQGPSVLARVTPADILLLAERYFDPAGRTEGVIRGRVS